MIQWLNFEVLDWVLTVLLVFIFLAVTEWRLRRELNKKTDDEVRGDDRIL